MIAQKIEKWLEQLGEIGAEKIVIRTGETRSSLSISGRYDVVIDNGVIVAPSPDEIEDGLLLSGFQDDKPFARCIAYDEKGRQIKSLSLKHNVKSDEQSSLVDGVLMMAAEMRRFVAVINTTLEQRENTLQHVIDQLLVAKYSEIESHAASIALDMELQKQEELSGVDAKDRALGIAEQMVGAMMAQKFSPEAIKELVLADPTIIDNLLQDDAVVGLVGEKFLAAKSK